MNEVVRSFKEGFSGSLALGNTLIVVFVQSLTRPLVTVLRAFTHHHDVGTFARHHGKARARAAR